MALKRKTKVTPMYSKEDAVEMSKQYLEVSENIKLLEAKKKELSDKLKSCAEMFGVKDDKGSYYCESDGIVFGRVAKKSVKLDQEKAVAMCKERGLDDLIDATVTYTVNEDRLESAIREDRLSINDLEDVTNVNVSYSVSVKKSEVAEEVVQTSFKKASRKK